ncbi:MAG: GAF domain-containing protein, partial [Candidatus Omnitrophica bacterium]|nr:GAF domain-containing protein [Candidatus Omnitrophota bacterium]
AEARLLKEDLKKYNTLKRFTRTLGIARDLGLDNLLKLIVYRLVKTLKVSYAAIYLFEEEEDNYSLKSGRLFKGLKTVSSGDNIAKESDFIRFILAWQKDFLLEDIQRLSQESAYYPPLKRQTNLHPGQPNNNSHALLSEVLSQMQGINAHLVIPHFLEKELIGFLVLGQKVSAKPYSEADIEVLTTLSRSASLAIMNALFMIDLKKTEGELAEAHRVAQIGYLSSAIGHQMKNILNNIVQTANSLLDNDSLIESIKDKPELNSLFGQRIQDIFSSAEDGMLIIDELRDYAKSDKDKDFSLVSLEDIIDRTIKVLSVEVHKFQNIDIAINVDKDVPSVLGSFVGLQNVFVNMFNNAYDAILDMRHYIQEHPQEGIADYRGKIEVAANRQKGNIRIHITDNGIGMTPGVLKRLFTPLYTTKASSEKRQEQKTTGGTGIGLYAILVIVKNHGGTIKVEKTEYLKGTDFLIELPIPREGQSRKKAR